MNLIVSDFQIFVKPIDGEVITVDVNNNDTIKSLKQKIEAKEGIPSDKQCLIFSRIILENERTLKGYDIRKGRDHNLIVHHND